jgi:predicted CopG family antitoxin
MTHTIKLHDKVYDELDEFRIKRETFSDAVYRLLLLHGQERSMLKGLAGKKEELPHETSHPG